MAASRWARRAIPIVVGAAMVALLLDHVGWGAVHAAIASAGPWCLVVVVIDVAGLACDAAAIASFARPHAAIAYRRAFVAQATGYVINQLTPGNSLGEPVKVSILGAEVPRDVAISAIVLYNLATVVVGAAAVAFGAPFALLALDVPPALGVASWIGVGVVVAAVAGLFVALRRGLCATSNRARAAVSSDRRRARRAMERAHRDNRCAPARARRTGVAARARVRVRVARGELARHARLVARARRAADRAGRARRAVARCPHLVALRCDAARPRDRRRWPMHALHRARRDAGRRARRRDDRSRARVPCRHGGARDRGGHRSRASAVVVAPARGLGLTPGRSGAPRVLRARATAARCSGPHRGARPCNRSDPAACARQAFLR